jgi:hypothetical protein
MSMKPSSPIVHALRRLAPTLLLTLGYAGVAEAQPAPIITLGNPCPAPPVNRIYRIAPGATPAAASNPYIAASDSANWTASGVGATPCTMLGTNWSCAGLTVSMPAGTATQTPNFTGTASTSAQVLNVAVSLGANSLSCRSPPVGAGATRT